MKLYHATSSANLESIFERGLLPREVTGKSNWSNCPYPSREGLVYLTDRHLLFYGAEAEGNDWDNGVYPLFIEVNINPQKLLPDEDYLGQILARERKVSLKDATGAVDTRANRHLWQMSLDQLGTAAHDGAISPKQIRRGVILRDLQIWDLYCKGGGAPDGTNSFAPWLGNCSYASNHRDLARLIMGECSQTDAFLVCGTGGKPENLRVQPGTREVIRRNGDRLVTDII